MEDYYAPSIRQIPRQQLWFQDVDSALILMGTLDISTLDTSAVFQMFTLADEDTFGRFVIDKWELVKK